MSGLPAIDTSAPLEALMVAAPVAKAPTPAPLGALTVTAAQRSSSASTSPEEEADGEADVASAASVTAGINFAFTMLAEIAAEGYAKALALGPEYAPAPPYGCGRPQFAYDGTLRLVARKAEKMMGQRAAEAKEAGARLSRYAVSP